MTYDITYRGISEAFLDRVRADKETTGKGAQEWLFEFDESSLAEAERLNVILPIIKWEIENNCLTEELEDELYLYYEDFVGGKLDDILAEYEAEEVIKDLTECYKKVFG